MSLMFSALPIAAEGNDYSTDVTVTHTTMYNLEDDQCQVWGKIYVQNDGDTTAYIASVDYLIQSEHSRWVTVKSESVFSSSSLEGAIELAPGETESFSYTTTFSPEEDNDSYRHRVVVEVYNSESSTSKFFSDNFISLGDDTSTTAAPTTTSPPTTIVNTYEYTPGATTAPPTTAAPEGSQGSTSSEDGTDSLDSDAMMVTGVQGTITNITTDIVNGGYAVCVEIKVTSGRIYASSLYLSITSSSETGWGKVYEDYMNIGVAGGLDSSNTPLTFCFEGIYLTGDIEDYEACVTWKQGYVGSYYAPIIDRSCVDFHQVPAIDLVTYGVILGTLAVIATVAVYLRRGK